jgi:hypothetical protein
MMSPPASDLPDPFCFGNATRVRTATQWGERRREIHDLLPLVSGALPPVPSTTRCVELHSAIVPRLGNARLAWYRVETDDRHAFSMRVFAPAMPTLSGPVLLNGDGCWRYASDEVIAAVLGRGYVFVQFNRLEIVSKSRRICPRPVTALWTRCCNWTSSTRGRASSWGTPVAARRPCWSAPRTKVSQSPAPTIQARAGREFPLQGADVGELSYPYRFSVIDKQAHPGGIDCEYRPRHGGEVGGSSRASTLDYFATP